MNQEFTVICPFRQALTILNRQKKAAPNERFGVSRGVGSRTV